MKKDKKAKKRKAKKAEKRSKIDRFIDFVATQDTDVIENECADPFDSLNFGSFGIGREGYSIELLRELARKFK